MLATSKYVYPTAASVSANSTTIWKQIYRRAYLITALANGGCDQYCNPRSGMCSCDTDYDMQAGVSCVFSNCYYDNGDCAQICSPDVGTCTCENGFELESDAKSCLDIEPPSITCPAHIRVQRRDGPLMQNGSVSYALTQVFTNTVDAQW